MENKRTMQYSIGPMKDCVTVDCKEVVIGTSHDQAMKYAKKIDKTYKAQALTVVTLVILKKHNDLPNNFDTLLKNAKKIY